MLLGPGVGVDRAARGGCGWGQVWVWMGSGVGVDRARGGCG